jgi:hypothetical protein
MTVYFASSYNLTDFNFINNSCPYLDDGNFFEIYFKNFFFFHKFFF